MYSHILYYLFDIFFGYCLLFLATKIYFSLYIFFCYQYALHANEGHRGAWQVQVLFLGIVMMLPEKVTSVNHTIASSAVLI